MDFGHNRFEILVFPRPTGSVFRFCFHWSKACSIDNPLTWLVISAKSWTSSGCFSNSTSSSVTSSRFSPFVESDTYIWGVVKRGFKSGYQKGIMCFKKDWTACSRFDNRVRFNRQYTWRKPMWLFNEHNNLHFHIEWDIHMSSNFHEEISYNFDFGFATHLISSCLFCILEKCWTTQRK